MPITVVPRKTYVYVFIALLVLLAATVVVREINLGALTLVLALAIAGAKALLVALYFMHIRYSSPVMRLFAFLGLAWLAILIGATLTDYLTRR